MDGDTEAMPRAAADGTSEHDALESLRRDWGHAYAIGRDSDKRWWAARKDGTWKLLTALTPDGLRSAMAEDYGPGGDVSAEHSLSLLQEQAQRQAARVEAALRAGWAIRRDPVRLEFTAAREMHTARTLDELLDAIEASDG